MECVVTVVSVCDNPDSNAQENQTYCQSYWQHIIQVCVVYVLVVLGTMLLGSCMLLFW